MFKLDLEKAEEPEINLPTYLLIIRKAREFQKSIYFCFTDYTKALTVWITANLKILKKMRILDRLTCLLRNLYAGQKATIKKWYGTIDWFQNGKGVHQSCMLSPCLLNFYAEYIMRNTGLEEAQAGIKIARRNINSFRYADDTTLMAESEEELKSLLIKVKEESGKAGLKLNIQKTKIMASSPITSWQINGETMETGSDLIFLGSKITADGGCSHEIKIHLFLLTRECMLLGSFSSQQSLAKRTLKPPPPVCHSSQVLACVIALRSWTDRVTALRKISVTAQCYSSILFR